MRIRDLSFLAIRILSVYTFLLGISQLVTLLNYSIPAYLHVVEDNTTYSELFLIIGLPAFAVILCGVVLWLFAKKLSRYLIPKNSRESEAAVKIKEIEGFVLSVIGLILIIISFGVIVRISLNYLYLTMQDFQYEKLSLLYVLAEQVIRFVIGIILLVKAEGFALILRKVRSFGLKHVSQKDGEL